MNKIFAKVLASPLVNQGVIGKVKDSLYDHLISGGLEARTDAYRKDILCDFYEAFNGIDWIVASGSFLRYYRDQTMDGQGIDILIRYEDFQKKKPLLIKKGYDLLAEFSDNTGRITEVKLKYKKAEIDIVFVFCDDDGWYYIGCYEDPEHEDQVIREVGAGKRIVRGEGYGAFRKSIPDFETAEYEFQGMTFKSYKHIEAHLIAEYGDEWRIPDPHFVWLKGPQNNPPQKVASAKVVYYFEPLKEY